MTGPSPISDESFEKMKPLLGLKKVIEKGNYTDDDKKKMRELIKQLGAAKFKERKAAKEALKEMGPEIIPFLKDNLNQKDFEITAALKELIKDFKPKKFEGKRPRIY